MRADILSLSFVLQGHPTHLEIIVGTKDVQVAKGKSVATAPAAEKETIAAIEA